MGKTVRDMLEEINHINSAAWGIREALEMLEDSCLSPGIAICILEDELQEYLNKKEELLNTVVICNDNCTALN